MIRKWWAMDITGEKPKDTNAVRHLLDTVWGGHGGTALKYEYQFSKSKDRQTIWGFPSMGDPQ